MSEQRESSAPPPRKRRRPALSCEQCRKRKIKCDREYPCGQCVQFKAGHCTYQGDVLPSSATGHVDSLATPWSAMHRPPEGAMMDRGDVADSARMASGGSQPREVDAATPNNIPSRNTTSSTVWSVKHAVAPRLENDTPGVQPSTYHTGYEYAAKPRQPGPHRVDVVYTPTGRPLGDDHDAPIPQALHDRLDMLERRLSTKTGSYGPTPQKERQKKSIGALEQKELEGTVSKTRFFGSSHWMHSFGMYERMPSLIVDPKSDERSFENTKRRELAEGLTKCKTLARQVKVKPHKEWLVNSNFRENFPPREICDQLVAIYFRTSESTSRVLHRPTFYKDYYDYWNNPAASPTVNIHVIQLVMSLGAVLYQGHDSATWRRQALQWIFAAQAWLASPFEKGRLHIPGLQVYCLVLMARLDNAVGGDLIWISAGALLRTAFQMGMHRDPRYLPNIKPLHTELRRRLWATILEWNVQSALDSGMPPLMSMEEFDTEPPSNIDDDQLNEDTKVFQPKPDGVFTQTSLQRLLMKSLSARVEVVRQTNSFHFEPSYDDVLQLGSELTSYCKQQNAYVARINALSPAAPRISQFQHNLLDLWVRRFLLVLHRPYAIKAQKDPLYYFSRKVSLDCAMTMMNYPADNISASASAQGSGIQDDYSRLRIISGCLYKRIAVHSSMMVWGELLSQLEEDSVPSAQSRAAREPLVQALRSTRELALQRVAAIDNNIKGHLFATLILAQIEAMERGANVDHAVLQAGTESVKQCYELLSQRFASTYPLRGEETYGGGMVEGSVFTPGTGTGTLGSTPDFNLDMGGAFNGMPDWIGGFDMPDAWLLSGWDENQSW